MSTDTASIHAATATGTVRIPGSKSFTHRAYLLASQSTTPCTVVAPLQSADTGATLQGLLSMGSRFDIRAAATHFSPATFHAPHGLVDCHNSGTTLRLLTGTAARFPWPTAFTGDGSLINRPNGPLLDALQSMGVRIDGGAGGHAPFQITGPLQPGDITLPPQISSQYGSSLLLSLPMLEGPSVLRLQKPIASAPYLEITLEVARAFGLTIQVEEEDNARIYHIPGSQTPNSKSYTVEPDWSTAAFPLAAAAITQGHVTIPGITPKSNQGDSAILAHLQAFGAHVEIAPGGVSIQGAPLQSPGSIDVQDTPDLFPILAVVAATAQGVTTFTGGQSLRHKESDRIHAMATALTAMGAKVTEHPDGMVINGGHPLQGTRVEAHNDHRIHMALCIAGLTADGRTEVTGRSSVTVSHRNFHDQLQILTGIKP